VRCLFILWVGLDRACSTDLRPDDWLLSRAVNARLAVRSGEWIILLRSQPEGGEGVDSERELILEDAGSIRQGLWRMARFAQHAAEALDGRIEDKDLDGQTEAVEARDVLERLQALSLEVSEELDAYQTKNVPQGR
jgi:hypothetical protein